MKKFFFLAIACIALSALCQTGQELNFQKWALTPPMGWNSWDCYGPTVVESEVKANADYMSQHLLQYGWEYIIVDIRWFVENDKAGGYNQTNPIYVYDEWGRYTPAFNRFPSAANGVGFKALAEYCHNKGLKFGIHLMRGIPKVAVQKKLPVKGAPGITCDMIANNDSACTWLRDNYKVDCTKPGAQEYYNSCFDMYADWGVDFVKIDDLSRPYHTGEITMIRHAIDQCGRPIVLSMSPGETPLDQIEHASTHANMWRTVDDFWDNWSQLNYQFGICAKWAPYIAPGTWPDADMLPLGRISIRGERGAERWSGFSDAEQQTMMTLWTIFKSPLMFGGNLPDNDRADNPSNTNALLTNRDVLYMHSYSVENKQHSNSDGRTIWTALDPANGDKFVALFNTGGVEFVNTQDALWRSGTISYLTTGYATDASVDIPAGSTNLALIVTDGGDGYDSDHADWINPTLTLADGSKVALTSLPYQRSATGWGSIGINKNINGGSLSIDGNKYANGFAVHANSILLFEIPDNAVKFEALAGIDNTGSDQGSKSSVEFMVFNYDPTIRSEWTDQWTGGNVELKIDPAKQAACSGYISRAAGQQRFISADISGAEKLYLVVTNGGDGFSYDHADWANPVLIDANGNETSLTTLSWDPNPINGWYAPKLNKNNDGNTMSIGGTEYQLGIGCNSPSMITFTLPQGHNFVQFKSIVGFDDDALNAPEGVTMEFRVFTQNPGPVEEKLFVLNLEDLGFAEGQQCDITDMWAASPIGSAKGCEYSVTLNNHASALYRITPTGRSQSTVSITAPADSIDATQEFPLIINVSGNGGWVQLLCDGKVIGTVPVIDGAAVFYCNGFHQGQYEFVAKYSGTASDGCAVSDPVNIAFKGNADGIFAPVADMSKLSVIPQAGAICVNAPEATTLRIYTVDGRLAQTAKLQSGSNRIALAPGTYAVAGRVVVVIR